MVVDIEVRVDETGCGAWTQKQEYGWILKQLGRVPIITELGIYFVMWSERCSYKNSIAVLRTLPCEGEALLMSAGDENTGFADIGDGLAVAYKINSQNYPSAVEPYRGAATGADGIHRMSLHRQWILEGEIHLYWFAAVSRR